MKKNAPMVAVVMILVMFAGPVMAIGTNLEKSESEIRQDAQVKLIAGAITLGLGIWGILTWTTYGVITGTLLVADVLTEDEDEE